MLEHTSSVKIIPVIGKLLIMLGVALGFEPLFELAVNQAEDFIFLSPFVKELLGELKIILGLIVTALVGIRVWYEIKKLRKK